MPKASHWGLMQPALVPGNVRGRTACFSPIILEKLAAPAGRQLLAPPELLQTVKPDSLRRRYSFCTDPSDALESGGVGLATDGGMLGFEVHVDKVSPPRVVRIDKCAAIRRLVVRAHELIADAALVEKLEPRCQVMNLERKAPGSNAPLL